MGLKGHVLDVSNSEFYIVGGSYHTFAGKDVSVCLGRMQLEGECLEMHDWENTLDSEQKIILEDWFNKLSVKYPVVGYLDNMY